MHTKPARCCSAWAAKVTRSPGRAKRARRPGKTASAISCSDKPGGIVSAAPGDAGWFHGHYGASKEPLRVLAFLGGYPRRVKGIPGVDWRGLNLDIKEGGNTIEYRDEDPYIRKMFEEQLAREGAAFNMPEEAYR